ncbi:hypothetical protein GIB67_038225 [Kingdonia uniflora]|uniref:Rubisco LSMT substrate-binding domain-containing protein n=1 Tax=Kingdonia uniflora TaxID=39325 RepID=A0A7J7NHW0_9MAGN|nr:hypothetical protein GIB67_038225 [Kingdonia uniflora]
MSIREVRSSRGKGKGIPQTLRAFARILSTTSPGELQEMEMEAEQNDGRLARRPLKNVSREIEAHHMLHTEVMHLIQEYDASVKTLRRVNHPSNDEKYAHRNQLAHDLLTGELRVLKSVSSWLTNYCATLSAQIVHSF